MTAARARRFAPFALAVLLACCYPSVALAERLPLQNFTMRDGLPSDSINCLERDRLGLMWVCTAEGLAYYDGFSFRAFTEVDGVPHRRVTRLLHARDGTYWVGTDNGLAWFRPSGRSPGQPRFTKLPMALPSNWTPDAIIARSVLALYQDRAGRIWCGTTSSGLFVVEDDEDRPTLRHVEIGLPIDTWVTGLAESDDGTFWVATTRGLWSRAAGEASAFVRRHVTAPEPMDLDILSLLIRGQKIFAGTRDTGLQLLDSRAPHHGLAVVRSWRTPGVQGGDRVLSLIQTSDGHLWFGGAGGAREVAPTDEAAHALRTWGASAGLGSSNVSAVAEDGGGNLWIGTDGAGVFRRRRGGFTQYTVDDGLAGDQIKDLFVAQGSLHVVTADVRGMVLNRFDGGRFHAAPTPYTLDAFHNRMNQLAAYDRQGNWWLATPDGFMRTTARTYDGVAAEPMRRYGRKDGLWTDEGYKVFVDSAGDVWMSSSGGFHNLAVWRRATGTIERHEVKTFPYGPGFGYGFSPETFAEVPDGVVWVGSGRGGIARYANCRWEHFDVAAGLPEGRVMTTLRDTRGRLWIGTSNGGLARVDDPSAARPVFVHLTKQDGLSSNHILSLTEDLDGRIYIGSGVGVDRLTPETMEVRTFSTADGLPGGRVVTAFRDPEGDLWFGTNLGLARFRPSAFEDPGWPTLRVMQVSAPDFDLGLSDLGERVVPGFELESHQNAVQIAIGALASGPVPGLRFEGRLDGSGSDWLPIEPGRPTMLLNLRPGAYRFVARATASGRVGPSTVSVAFTILRPWWRRPWALAFEALVVIGLVAAAYNLRVRHLLAIERVRARIASDLHDDVGASLSRVALLSEAARRHEGPDREAVALGALAQVASTARATAAQMADVVWANDLRHDTVGNVIGRASWFASELFALRGTEWRCAVDEAAAERRLDPEEKRHLLLLLKEALNNIAKHAEASVVSLEARVVEGALTITMGDDGRGFDVAAARNGERNGQGAGNGHGHDPRGGRGLSNMHERARALGGTCTIDSAPGHGCRITLRLP